MNDATNLDLSLDEADENKSLQLWFESMDPFDPTIDPEDYPSDEEIAEIMKELGRDDL